MPENTINIFDAVKMDDIEAVKRYINNGGDVNEITEDDNEDTPLHLCKSLQMAKILVDAGADVNARNSDVQTPICLCPSREIAEFLIDQGAYTSWDEDEAYTPLHFCENPDVARLLIAYGADVEAENEDGEYPLHTCRNAEVAKVLIEHGADVDIQNSDGFTPIGRCKNAEIAKVLIDAGADAYAEDSSGNSAIDVFLMHMVEKNDMDAVKFAIENGANVNVYIVFHGFPLQACRSTEFAKFLIEHGADVNAKDDAGNTPLHECYKAEVAKVLIEHGADVNAKNKSGDTPLQKCDNAEIAKLLIDAGADVNAKNNDGKTPLDRDIVRQAFEELEAERKASPAPRVNLSKGQKVDLTKANPSLKKIMVGLGWDTNKYSGGDAFDLDATAFLLNADGKVAADTDFVFYNNLEHPSKSVKHMGDNRTGEGEGDDEQIMVDLSLVPANIEKIAFAVTIHDAEARKQTFGQVSNAFIRIVDAERNTEICRYDLGEDFSTETAVVVGEIYRRNGDWKFGAIGGGFNGGLEAVCKNFGVNV